MSIIVHNTQISSEFIHAPDGVIVHFHDPAYVRSEQLLIDPDHRLFGVILHEGLHKGGYIPENADLDIILSLKTAHMRSNLPNGNVLSLFAPVLLSKLQ